MVKDKRDRSESPRRKDKDKKRKKNKEAHLPPPLGSAIPTPIDYTCRVHLSNISLDATADILRAFLESQCGALAGLMLPLDPTSPVPRHQGHGYVDFMTQDDAQKCMKITLIFAGKELKKRLGVDAATPPIPTCTPPLPAPPPLTKPSKTLVFTPQTRPVLDAEDFTFADCCINEAKRLAHVTDVILYEEVFDARGSWRPRLILRFNDLDGAIAVQKKFDGSLVKEGNQMDLILRCQFLPEEGLEKVIKGTKS